MVARLCYEEARTTSLNVSIPTRSEQAAIAGEAERCMYTKMAEGVVSGSEA